MSKVWFTALELLANDSEEAKKMDVPTYWR
jgi:hypothetical protein